MKKNLVKCIFFFFNKIFFKKFGFLNSKSLKNYNYNKSWVSGILKENLKYLNIKLTNEFFNARSVLGEKLFQFKNVFLKKKKIDKKISTRSNVFFKKLKDHVKTKKIKNLKEIIKKNVLKEKKGLFKQAKKITKKDKQNRYFYFVLRRVLKKKIRFYKFFRFYKVFIRLKKFLKYRIINKKGGQKLFKRLILKAFIFKQNEQLLTNAFFKFYQKIALFKYVLRSVTDFKNLFFFLFNFNSNNLLYKFNASYFLEKNKNYKNTIFFSKIHSKNLKLNKQKLHFTDNVLGFLQKQLLSYPYNNGKHARGFLRKFKKQFKKKIKQFRRLNVRNYFLNFANFNKFIFYNSLKIKTKIFSFRFWKKSAGFWFLLRYRKFRFNIRRKFKHGIKGWVNKLKAEFLFSKRRFHRILFKIRLKSFFKFFKHSGKWKMINQRFKFKKSISIFKKFKLSLLKTFGQLFIENKNIQFKDILVKSNKLNLNKTNKKIKKKQVSYIFPINLNNKIYQISLNKIKKFSLIDLMNVTKNFYKKIIVYLGGLFIQVYVIRRFRKMAFIRSHKRIKKRKYQDRFGFEFYNRMKRVFEKSINKSLFTVESRYNRSKYVLGSNQKITNSMKIRMLKNRFNSNRFSNSKYFESKHDNKINKFKKEKHYVINFVSKNNKVFVKKINFSNLDFDLKYFPNKNSNIFLNKYFKPKFKFFSDGFFFKFYKKSKKKIKFLHKKNNNAFFIFKNNYKIIKKSFSLLFFRFRKIISFFKKISLNNLSLSLKINNINNKKIKNELLLIESFRKKQNSLLLIKNNQNLFFFDTSFILFNYFNSFFKFFLIKKYYLLYNRIYIYFVFNSLFFFSISFYKKLILKKLYRKVIGRSLKFDMFLKKRKAKRYFDFYFNKIKVKRSLRTLPLPLTEVYNISQYNSNFFNINKQLYMLKKFKKLIYFKNLSKLKILSFKSLKLINFNLKKIIKFNINLKKKKTEFHFNCNNLFYLTILKKLLLFQWKNLNKKYSSFSILKIKQNTSLKNFVFCKNLLFYYDFFYKQSKINKKFDTNFVSNMLFKFNNNNKLIGWSRFKLYFLKLKDTLGRQRIFWKTKRIENSIFRRLYKLFKEKRRKNFFGYKNKKFYKVNIYKLIKRQEDRLKKIYRRSSYFLKFYGRYLNRLNYFNKFVKNHNEMKLKFRFISRIYRRLGKKFNRLFEFKKGAKFAFSNLLLNKIKSKIRSVSIILYKPKYLMYMKWFKRLIICPLQKFGQERHSISFKYDFKKRLKIIRKRKRFSKKKLHLGVFNKLVFSKYFLNKDIIKYRFSSYTLNSFKNNFFFSKFKLIFLRIKEELKQIKEREKKGYLLIKNKRIGKDRKIFKKKIGKKFYNFKKPNNSKFRKFFRGFFLVRHKRRGNFFVRGDIHFFSKSQIFNLKLLVKNMKHLSLDTKNIIFASINTLNNKSQKKRKVYLHYKLIKKFNINMMMRKSDFVLKKFNEIKQKIIDILFSSVEKENCSFEQFKKLKNTIDVFFQQKLDNSEDWIKNYSFEKLNEQLDVFFKQKKKSLLLSRPGKKFHSFFYRYIGKKMFFFRVKKLKSMIKCLRANLKGNIHFYDNNNKEFFKVIQKNTMVFSIERIKKISEMTLTENKNFDIEKISKDIDEVLLSLKKRKIQRAKNLRLVPLKDYLDNISKNINRNNIINNLSLKQRLAYLKTDFFLFRKSENLLFSFMDNYNFSKDYKYDDLLLIQKTCSYKLLNDLINKVI